MNEMQYYRDITYGSDYHKLFRALAKKEFKSMMPLDDNVIEYARDLVESLNHKRPDNVSVLSGLVALAIKIENELMYDESAGDRTAEWFWEMIRNLGLEDLDDNKWDDKYDITTVNKAVDKFINRQYKKDGSDGGLFHIHSRHIDMTKEPLWMQANYWVVEAYRYEVQ